MAKGPIQLFRGGTGEQVFTGEASPAPGGGSMPEQGVYNGDGVTIANGDDGLLDWSNFTGADLLDYTDHSMPVVRTAGVYAVTAVVVSTTALSPGGVAKLSLGCGGAVEADTASSLIDPFTPAGLSVTAVLAAGDVVMIQVHNADGAASRDFALIRAVVVKVR